MCTEFFPHTCEFKTTFFLFQKPNPYLNQAVSTLTRLLLAISECSYLRMSTRVYCYATPCYLLVKNHVLASSCLVDRPGPRNSTRNEPFTQYQLVCTQYLMSVSWTFRYTVYNWFNLKYILLLIFSVLSSSDLYILLLVRVLVCLFQVFFVVVFGNMLVTSRLAQQYCTRAAFVLDCIPTSQ